MGIEILLPLILSLVGGAGSLIGTGLLNRSQNKTNIQLQEMTNQNNIDLQNMANQQNLSLNEQNNLNNLTLWREQMRYNSPEAQLNRMSKAGINPISAYTNIQTTMPNPPRMESGTVDATSINAPQINNSAIMSVLPQVMNQLANSGQNIAQNKLIQEQIKSAQIQNNLNEALLPTTLAKNIKELENLGINSEKLRNEVRILAEDITTKSLLNENLPERISLELEKIGSEIDNIDAQTTLNQTSTKLKQFELEYQQATKEDNIKLLKSSISKIYNEINLSKNADLRESLKYMTEKQKTELQNAINTVELKLKEMELNAYDVFKSGSNGIDAKTLILLKSIIN